MSTDNLVAIIEKNIGPETLAIGVSSTFWNGLVQTNRNYPEPDWVLNAHRVISFRHKSPWLLGGYASSSTGLTQDWWVKFYGNAEDALLKWMDENSSKLIRRDPFDIKTSTKSFVKDEFIRNYEEWGTTKYYFLDDTVNESVEKIRALADIAQSLPFRLEWTGYNRLDLVCRLPGMSQMLKDSGLRTAYFGIESFHPRASLVVGKGWSGKESKDFLLKLKKEWGKDITWYLSFIIGLPGEDRASIEDSNQWCVDNEMYEWNFHALSINRSSSKLLKSEFDREYEKYGYSFPFEHDPLNWKNELWTFRTALTYADDILKRTTDKHLATAWFLASLVGIGYTYDELMHTPKIEFDWEKFKRQTKKIVDDYVAYQLR
jgi:hypothetical protein